MVQNGWARALWMTVALVLGLVIARLGNQALSSAAEGPASGPMLAHCVYFSLKDPTDANKQKLLDGCHKWLSRHPGTTFYSAGKLSDLNRPVNDRDWDIALVLIFENVAAHDVYQTSADHEKFIAECEPLWDHVRVFDADVTSQTK